MAIQVYCVCGRELVEPGGLLLSPPDDDGRCRKRHLCDVCYSGILTIVEQVEANVKREVARCSECGWIGTLDHHLSPNASACSNTGIRATRLRVDSTP